MSNRKSFLRCWLFVCWFPLAGALIAVAIQTNKSTWKPQIYVSRSKLVAGFSKQAAASMSTGIQYMDYHDDFCGTILETLESSEMSRRALDRLRKLHPGIKESDVEIRASMKRDSATFNVRAFGSDPEYTRIFLDALIDEFIAFREQIRETQRNKALTTLIEDLDRRDKSLGEKQNKLTTFEKTDAYLCIQDEVARLTQRLLKLRDERDELSRKLGETPTAADVDKRLTSTKKEIAGLEAKIEPLAIKAAVQDGLTNDYQAAKHAHDEVVDLVHRFKADEVDNTDHVTILERASPAVEDLQEWMDLIGRGSHYGALVGFILSLINAAVIHRFSGTSELPPLTASPSIP